jgi:hypothetical protein
MQFDKKEIEKRILRSSSAKWKHLGFAMLPTRILMDEKLSKSSLLIFWVLTVHIFKGKQSCFPSLETMSNESHCSKPTTIKAIKELEKLGYLEVDRSLGRNSNKYYLKAF